MPHTDSRGGTLLIDRRFPGVGRIKRASGTTQRGVFGRIDRMLTALADEGRLDLLRAIHDHELAPLEVLDAYQRKALHELPTAKTARKLDEAMRSWIDGLRVPQDVSREHKAMCQTARRHFGRLKPGAMVADLAGLVEQLRDDLGREHPAAFNNARAVALAFVRDTLRRSHPLWSEVAAVERRRKAGRATARRPLTPDEMRERFPAPATDPVDAIAWGMAMTGMGQKEYWGRWVVKVDRIHVHGTKREGRDRDIPLVVRPAPPRMHRRTFENKLRARDRAFTPYNLRRTFANWMEAAGIPRTRRKLYLGHGATDVSDLYERHEVAAFLAEDARKLRAHIGPLPDRARPGLSLVAGGQF